MIPVGASGSAVAAPPGAGDEPDTSVREVRGRKRGMLLRRANRSSKVDFVAGELGRSGVSSVIEYSVNGDSGYGVTFGQNGRGNSGHGTIHYYESDDLPGPTVKAVGSGPVGDGVRMVEGDNQTTADFETPDVVNMIAELANNSQYQEIAQAVGSGTIAEEFAVLVRKPQSQDDRFNIHVPIERAGELTDRLLIAGQGTLETISPEDVSVVTPSSGGGFSTQRHVGCGPFDIVCTDYCAILCGAIGAAAAGGCGAACSGTVVGIPIAPSCATLCGLVGAGVCYPTCANLSGH